MTMSPAQAATLLVFAINANPHREDLIFCGVDFGCCPQCCAACFVIRELLESGEIDDVLRDAPTDLGVERHGWWDTEHDRFDRSWAEAWWNLYPCTNHHPAPPAHSGSDR